jgi:hypothetical protein
MKSDDLVPYLPVSRRLARAGAMFACVVAAGFAAYVAVGGDLVLVVAAAALTMLLFLPVSNWWAARHGAVFISRGERERRYATEMVTQPLWQGVMWRTVIYAIVVPMWVLLVRAADDPRVGERLWILPLLIGAMLPFGVAIGYVSALAERRGAQQWLASAGSSDEAWWPRLADVGAYFVVIVVMLVTGALGSFVGGLLAGERVYRVVGFLVGIAGGLALGVHLSRRAHLRAKVRRSPFRIDFARAVVWVGFGFGFPAGLILVTATLIAGAAWTWTDVAMALLGTIGTMLGAGLFLWAFLQAADWTPGYERTVRRQ